MMSFNNGSKNITGGLIFRLIFILSVLLFAFGILLKLKSTPAEWDWLYLMEAESFMEGGIPPLTGENTPLYTLVLSVFFRVFGSGIAVARFANAVILISAAFFVWKTGKYLGNRNSGLLAASIFLMNPVIIQGSTLVDSGDTTLLALGFAFFMWAAVRIDKNTMTVRDILLITAAVTICYWTKVASTLALSAGVFFWLIVKHRGLHLNLKDKMIKTIVSGVVLGLILFLLTWVTVSFVFWDKNVCLKIVFIFLKGFKCSVASSDFFTRLLKFFVYSMRIAFWFSPFLILLFLYSAGLIEAEKTDDSRNFSFLWWVSFFYFFGYLIIGGASWGFPRYQTAIFPFMVVLTAVYAAPIINIFTKKETMVFLGIITGFSAVYVAALPDPVFSLNLGFKKAILNGEIFMFTAKFLVQSFIYVAVPVSLIFTGNIFFPNRDIADRIVIFLVAGLLITNAALDIKQAIAGYMTSYEYGAQGKKEVVDFLKRNIEPNDFVLATPGLLHELREKRVSFVSLSVWDHPESVYNELKISEPEAVVMSVTAYPVDKWIGILGDARINAIIRNEYKRYDIGTYNVWLRKSGGNR